jgi:hypothetical protein
VVSGARKYRFVDRTSEVVRPEAGTRLAYCLVAGRRSVIAIPGMPMPTSPPEQIWKDIETLSEDDLTHFCTLLCLNLKSLTDGAFEVLPLSVAKNKRAADRLLLKIRLGQVDRVQRIADQALASTREAVRLAREYRADSVSARAEAETARAREARRRRQPTVETTSVMVRVAELVAGYKAKHTRVKWKDIADRIYNEYGQKYAPKSLSSMYHREVRSGRIMAGGRKHFSSATKC